MGAKTSHNAKHGGVIAWTPPASPPQPEVIELFDEEVDRLWAASTNTSIPMNAPLPRQRHPHYFREVAHLTHVDVYRVLELFEVTDQAVGHAIKKLLLAGRRGRKAELGQSMEKDIKEAIDTLQRWQEMQAEDAALVNAELSKELFVSALVPSPWFAPAAGLVPPDGC